MEGLKTAEAVAKSQRSLIAALPAAFFIACGQPNQERSSLPVLTVLPLLTGEHQEEGEWVEKTRVQTSGSGRHPEVFFCPLRSQYVFRPPPRPRHGSPEGLR